MLSDAWFTESGANITKTITHWMKLPKSPKEENGEQEI
jgi:hypothetical protein